MPLFRCFCLTPKPTHSPSFSPSFSVGPDVRVMIVHDGKLDPFIRMANSPLLEYRRTAAVAMASFTLHEANKGD